MEKKTNKNAYLLLALALICLFGISYAIFNYTFTSSNPSKITTADISMELLESNTNVISLEKAIPMSDSEGKSQSSVFDFAVTTKTPNNAKILYSITLTKPTATSGYTFLDDSAIKVYLTDLNNNQIVAPTKVSALTNYVLYSKTNTHSASTTTIKDKYRLRMWIDEGVDASSWTSATKLEYKLKVNVSGQRNS